MLLTLQQFYRQQEIEYLRQNGRAMSNVLAGFLVDGTELSFLESQLTTFSFLTQSRIELFNSDDQLLVDSGSPNAQNGIVRLALQVETDGGKQEFSQNIETDGSAYEAEILIDDGNQSIRTQASVSGRTTLEEEFFTPLHLIGSVLLDPAESVFRSEQIVIVPIGVEFDRDIGYLKLSEGPAYGRSIIRSVGWGLIVAGGLATVLTSLLGWWLSGRLVQPLDELAAVSQQMGQGNLAVRSEIKRHDEIGRVAVSFNQMAERINGTVSSLRRFVGDAAHEINTPITALKGNLELLESGVANEQSHLLKQALDQTSRIQTLSADLLQLSELDGAVPVEMARLDWADLIRQQNERIAAEAEQAGIEFTADLPTSPIWVSGHSSSLLSLYQNLIDNALKFTPAGGGIQVALVEDGELAVLKVCDNGIGLEGEPGQLFERFYREPQVSAYAGNGLGLAICAKVAEQHGGSISADSNQGQTEFLFKIARS